MEEVKIRLIYPPKEAFRKANPEISRTLGKQVLFMWDRTELSKQNGIMRWYKDVPYPEKGFPFLEALKAIGLVKRATTIILKNVSILKLLSKKRRLAAFGDYCYMADTTLSGYYLEDEYLCPFAKETKKFLTVFLNETGYCTLFADIFSFFVQYDDNYRYRLQDVLSESSELNFAYPQEEILRLLDISLSRDKTNFISSVKFYMCVRVINFLLYFPKLRRAFNKALNEIDFKNLKLDEADKYFCLMRGDYDYFGQDFETRKKEFDKLNPIQPKQLIF